MPAEPTVEEEASPAARPVPAWRRWAWEAARDLGLLPRRRAIPAGEHDTIASADPLALCRALEGSERFHRDTRLGGILHGGKISFREKTPTDSLHIIIEGSRISAHVDEICPLRMAEDGSARYSLGKVLAHNLAVALGDLSRRFAGKHGEQRCKMVCGVEWVDDDEVASATTREC